MIEIHQHRISGLYRFVVQRRHERPHFLFLGGEKEMKNIRIEAEVVNPPRPSLCFYGFYIKKNNNNKIKAVLLLLSTFNKEMGFVIF